MRLFTSRLGKAGAVACGVPAAGFGGLFLYIQYRTQTRPPPHVFRSNIDANGNLSIEGRPIAPVRAVSVIWRVIQLVCIFAPVAALYLIMSLRETWYRIWLRWLLRAVERAGPAFIKAGQWSCTREDFFSPESRAVFKQLYNEVDVHPYESTLQILSEELGRDPFEVFERVDPHTVGSGSIGQVHLARLRNSNKDVVVKVMHPHVVEIIAKDFAIIMGAARLAHGWVPALRRFNLPALARDFTTHLAAQLDFRQEAENLELFRRNFRRERFVEFPEPLISSQRMLVETFCEGEPADPEFLATLPSHARRVLATKGLNTWCQMLLRDNFVHGDMHPGNILINCSDIHEPTVTLIDAGLCQHLTDQESSVTRDLMESFVRWNPVQCADSIWRMSSSQEYGEREHFTEKITTLFSQFRPTRNDEQAVSRILSSIFTCIREEKVQMDPAYVSLLFSVLVLESFIMNLDSEFNMVRHAAPWLVSEGHISKGVLKNVLRSQWDLINRELGIFTGRASDQLEKDTLTSERGIRVSSSVW